MVTHRKSASRPAPRDSGATRERILRAVGALLARRGFSGLGVNAIAREARVDKVLIYRYFGGLPELLEAFASEADFWPSPEDAAGGAGPRASAAEVGTALLQGLLRGLRARPMTQEILRWELAVSDELTEKLAQVRERRGLEMMRRAPALAKLPAAVDAAAVAALLSAGIIYLVLRAKGAKTWLGVSLDTEEGWARIERTVETLVRAVLRDAGREVAP